MKTVIYIAGPMTGYPEHNYPAFNAEAFRLRSLGFEVLNPAEGPAQDSWAAYMRQALRMVLGATHLVLLPGWLTSRGANLEHQVATELGMRCLLASDVDASLHIPLRDQPDHDDATVIREAFEAARQGISVRDACRWPLSWPQGRLFVQVWHAANDRVAGKGAAA